MWASAPSARLAWVSRGDMTTADKLNERPIYMRAVFFTLAIAQSVRHIYNNSSSLVIPVVPSPAATAKDRRTHALQPISALVQREALQILIRSSIVAGALNLFGPVYYTLFLRQVFWTVHLHLAKIFVNLSRSNTRPVGYPPCNPLLMLQTFLACLMLLITWEATSFLFRAYLVQEPWKKGQSLSASSNDPNGTLLTGLKAKRDIVRTFAFWELALIAERDQERRKAIFADIDRPGGARWGQTLEAALEVVTNVSLRIKTGQPVTPALPDQKTSPRIEKLPRIARDASTKPVLTNTSKPSTKRKQAEAIVGSSMKWIGESSSPWSPPVDQVKGLIDQGMASSRVRAVQEKLPKDMVTTFLTSPVGWIFRQTPERNINALVLGSPMGNAALIVDAIEGTTRMLVASLSEDVYGKAVAGVPGSVRAFTEAIELIQQLLQQHQDLDKRDLIEVHIILKRLQAGLEELLSAFQLYLADVGLGIKELNAAKKAAGTTVSQDEAKGRHGKRQIEEPRQNNSDEHQVERDIFEAYRSSKSKMKDKQNEGQQRIGEQSTSASQAGDTQQRAGRLKSGASAPTGGLTRRLHQAPEMEMVR